MLFTGIRPSVALLVTLSLAIVVATALRRWLVCACAFGALVSGFACYDGASRRWSIEQDGVKVLGDAHIVSIPDRDADGVAFDVEFAALRPERFASRIWHTRVYWPGADVLPEAGDTWRITLRMAPPRAALNPGSVDRERLWFRDGIHALGTVVDGPFTRRIAAGPPSLLRLRAHLARVIRARIADRDAAALLAALGVGVTGAMSAEQWRVFAATGTTHLVAISGLHVTLLATLTVFAVRRLWRATASSSWPDRDNVAASLGLLAAAAYAALAGFSVPTQRTLVMFAVWWVARLSGRMASATETIGLALLAVLVIDPLAPLSAGFWLSFAAVAALLVGEGRPGGGRGLGAFLAEQRRVAIVLLPLTILWFDRASLVGVVVNLVAIPVFSLLLVPATLAGLLVVAISPGLAGLCFDVAAWVYRIGWPPLAAAADLPWGAATIAVSAPQLCLLALALPWWLIPGLRAPRAVAALIMLLALAPAPSGLRSGEFTVHVLDAGRGTAMIVQTRSHVLLIGTGDVYGTRGQRALSIVTPALRVLGIRHVDRLVLSRGSSPEVAGYGVLRGEDSVGALTVAELWPGTAPDVDACDRVRHDSWDGVLISVFPDRGAGVESANPQYASACIVRVAGPAGSLIGPLRIPAAQRPLAADSLAVPVTAPTASVRAPLAADLAVLQGGGASLERARSWANAIVPSELVVLSEPNERAFLQRVAERWRLERPRVHSVRETGAIRIDSRVGLGIRVGPARPEWRAWVWRAPRAARSAAPVSWGP